MPIMSTNFGWKHEYDVKLWCHKHRTSNTNDHCLPLNETPHENFLRTPLGAKTLSFFSLSPSGDRLWQGRLVPTLTDRPEEAGAMGRSCQFHRLSLSSRKAWNTINKLTGRPSHSSRLCPVSANSICFTTCEEWGTQDEGQRIHKAGQPRGVQPKEGPKTWGRLYLWPLHASGAC